MNIPLDNIVSVSDIQKNYRKIFDKAKRTKQPIMVMKDNEPDVVVVDVKVLQILQEKAQETELKDVLKAIKIGRKEKRAGKLKVLAVGGLKDLASISNED